MTASSRSSAGRTHAGSVSGPRHSRSTRPVSLGRERRRRRGVDRERGVLARRTDDAHAWRNGLVRRKAPSGRLGTGPCRAARTGRARARRTRRGSRPGARSRAPTSTSARRRTRRPRRRRSTRRGRRARAPRTAGSRGRDHCDPNAPRPSGGWRSTTDAMPQQTAITLADPAGTPAPSANATRTAALSRVVPTETRRQRDMRCTIACRAGGSNRRRRLRTGRRRIRRHREFPITTKRTPAASDQVATRTTICTPRFVVDAATSASAALVAAIDPA